MKKVLLFIALLVSVFSVKAQDISYQGEVSIGYGIGVKYQDTDRIPLHIINGVRVKDYLFVGIGTGVEYYCYYKDFMSRSTYVIPVFVNIKGYLPVSKIVSPFVSLDLGCGIGAGEFSGLGGILATPSIGFSFNVSRGFALNFSVGYAYQKMKQSNLFDAGADNSLLFKLGFQF